MTKLTCRVCGETKVRRELEGSVIGMRSYVDEQGKRWNGHTCPRCHSRDMGRRIKRAREQER